MLERTTVRFHPSVSPKNADSNTSAETKTIASGSSEARDSLVVLQECKNEADCDKAIESQIEKVATDISNAAAAHNHMRKTTQIFQALKDVQRDSLITVDSPVAIRNEESTEQLLTSGIEWFRDCQQVTMHVRPNSTYARTRGLTHFSSSASSTSSGTVSTPASPSSNPSSAPSPKSP